MLDKKLLKKLHPRKAEEAKIASCNYQALKRGAVGVITLEDWEGVKEKYNYTCLCCGQQEPNIILTLDHVLPVCKGGTNYIENIQPLCGPCNYSKGDKDTDYRLKANPKE